MKKPEFPSDRQIFEGEIASYWLEDSGILVSVSKSPRRTIENIKGNIALVRSITGGKKVPLLIYLSNSPVPDKATRAFVAKELPNVYTAMAMLSDSGLGKIIINLIFRLNPPSIPMKSFSDPAPAREWLMKFL